MSTLNLSNQVALVLGATGVVGSGAVQQFLEAGARVVVVARTEEKLKDLLNKFAPRKSQLIGVVGHFDTRAQVEEIRTVIKAALNGETVDHVVSTIGFMNLTPDGISTGDIDALKTCFDDSLFPTILCAQVFLQDIKDKEGATYTIVSGGFAHQCPTPNAWVGTVKNAAMNGVIASLACDTANNRIRVNGNCIHYGIGMPWDERNQIGLEAETSNIEFAKTFLQIIHRKDIKGRIICHETPEDTERFLSGLHVSAHEQIPSKVYGSTKMSMPTTASPPSTVTETSVDYPQTTTTTTEVYESIPMEKKAPPATASDRTETEVQVTTSKTA